MTFDAPVITLTCFVVVAHEALTAAPEVQPVLQRVRPVRCTLRQTPDHELDYSAIGQNQFLLEEKLSFSGLLRHMVYDTIDRSASSQVPLRLASTCCAIRLST